jgi:serine/threonine-protein kinase RsbW
MTDLSETARAPRRDDSWAARPWRLPLLCVPAELTKLTAVERYTRAVANRGSLGKAAGARLRLAVEELAVNTITHGYAGNPGRLRLSGGGGDRSAWIVLEDDAPPFAPLTAHRLPATLLPVAERPVGGLGIHLALDAADEYEYEYEGSVNRSTVTVRRRVGEGD